MIVVRCFRDKASNSIYFDFQLMEEDVNTFFLPLLEKAQRDPVEAKKGFHFEILTLQIQHLMASLDVLVDAWNFDQANQSGDRRDFQRDKMFLHAVK